MAGLLAHEAAHWLHTFIKPNFFYKKGSYTNIVKCSPSKMKLDSFPSVEFNDFGRLVECAYYHGAMTPAQATDRTISTHELHRTIDGINFLLPTSLPLTKMDGEVGKSRVKSYVFVLVTSVSGTGWLKKETYSGSNGLNFPEVTAAMVKAQEDYEAAEARVIASVFASLVHSCDSSLSIQAVDSTGVRILSDKKRQRTGWNTEQSEENDDEEQAEFFLPT